MPTVTAGFGILALNSPPLSVCQTRSQRDAVGIEVPLGTEGEAPTDRCAAQLAPLPGS